MARPRFRSCERKMAEYEAASRMHRVTDARTGYNPTHTAPESTWLPLYHLLSIMKFNAHGASLAPADEAQLEHIQRALPPGAPKLSMWAAFALASKAAHSCVPNCLWTTRNPYGAASYFAAQPIAAGDLITISYFSNADEPTLERWEEMARA
ncbi:hypothetical protein JKP88DRAFT_283976 [Tribonema minus]|uniref:SET domain-containing protein n=1 Tax=Tribonema minus TaxID=303371 RepID=A0A836C7M2_9STRA|nr:hypothetical protein JKP88DRAFT_283976 [Tribonema minus]